MDFADLNYTAIIVGTIIAFLVGWVWYGPIFGERWMAETGLKKSDMSGPMAPHMVQGLIVTFIMGTFMAYVLEMAGAMSTGEAVRLAGLVGLGFVATFAWGEVNWERKSAALWFIKVAYNLLALSIIAAVYVNWPA